MASRVRTRLQLATDSYKPYMAAVEDVFGADIDLVKLYGGGVGLIRLC